MSGSDPKPFAHKVVTLGLYMLIAAIAVSVAVHLIESVWVGLVVIVGLGSILVAVIAVWRRRTRGW